MTETKICRICGKKFKVSKRNNKGRLPEKVRQKNSVTCSKKCAGFNSKG